MRTYHPALWGVATVLALLTAGCANNDADPQAQESPSATASTSAPTSPTPTPKTSEELAQASLERYFTVAEKAEKSGKLTDLEALSTVAAGDAYFNERKKILDYRANGVRLQGTVQHTLGDIATRGASTFVIADCEDRSKAKVVVLSSGNEVPLTDPQGNPVPDQVPVDYMLTKRAKDEWVVESVDVRWREQC